MGYFILGTITSVGRVRWPSGLEVPQKNLKIKTERKKKINKKRKKKRKTKTKTKAKTKIKTKAKTKSKM